MGFKVAGSGNASRKNAVVEKTTPIISTPISTIEINLTEAIRVIDFLSYYSLAKRLCALFTIYLYTNV